MIKNKLIFSGISAALCVGIGLTLYYAPLYYEGTKECSASDGDVLIVGTNASFPPFEYYHKGRIEGFDIDLIHELAKKIHKKVVIKEMSFTTLLLEAQAGRIHVIAAALTATAEREKKLCFTRNYLENDPIIAITRAKDQPHKITDLFGKEVIVNDGYTAESFMEQYKDVILRRIPTPAEAFLALQSGRAYAYVSSQSAVQPFFDRYGKDNFSVLILDSSDSCAFAVPRSLPALCNELDNALKQLSHDGTLQSLKGKWHLNF